jgi:acetyltransferase
VLSRVEADALIMRTRISAALKGIRNRPAVQLALLADTLIRYSHMIVELPEIAESDINPLLAWENGVIALDARIVLKLEIVGD